MGNCHAKSTNVFVIVLGSITRGRQRNECLYKEGPGVSMASGRGAHGTGVANDLGFAEESALRRGISTWGSNNKERVFHISESDLSGEVG